MITLAQVIEVFRAQLAADSALVEWCGQKFGKAPLVRVGIDPRADRETAYVPAVWLSSARKSGGRSVEQRTLSVACDLFLRAGPDSRQGGPALPQETNGANADLEAFADLVEAALETALDATNLCLDETDLAFEFVENYPVASARLIVTMRVPVVIGGTVELTS